MKIGIMGGTFDPIHNGHLYIAKRAKKEFSLDKVLFIPTGVSYMKTGVSKAEHRYEMVRLAIKDYPDFEISDLEVFRGGNTYTFETLEELKKIYPGAKLYFIIGTDTLFMLEKWRNFESIFANATILVADREGAERDKQSKKADELKKKYDARIKFMKAEPYNISATLLRASFKIPSPAYRIKPDCPDLVAKYAEEHELYSQFPMNDDEILELLKLDLKPKRVVHSLGVRDTAVELAEIHHLDVDKARRAALLHDCAKYLSLDDKIKLCHKYDYPVTPLELDNPELLHAKAGAALAAEKYGVTDPEILDAIRYHTTGKPNMSPLTLVIFISDYIEPGRSHSPRLNDFRALAMENLAKCAACILEETCIYLEQRPNNKTKAIDPTTKQSYEFYKIYLEAGE